MVRGGEGEGGCAGAVVRGEAAREIGRVMDGSAAVVKGGAARGEGGIHRQQCDGVGG